MAVAADAGVVVAAAAAAFAGGGGGCNGVCTCQINHRNSYMFLRIVRIQPLV